MGARNRRSEGRKGMSRTRLDVVAALTVLLLAFALAACGGDDDDEGEAAGTTTEATSNPGPIFRRGRRGRP